MISVTALCIIMGGACLLYYLIMFFYIGRIGDFAWFWLLNAAVFLSATWLRSLTQSWSRVLAGILLAAEGIGILLVVSSLCTDTSTYLERTLALELLRDTAWMPEAHYTIHFTRIFFGLTLIFLSQIFRIGRELQEDQELTI